MSVNRKKTKKETQAMFTRDTFQTDPNGSDLKIKSDRLSVYTDKQLGLFFAGPILDPFWTGSRMVPCKLKPTRSGSVGNGYGPVPCKRSFILIGVIHFS